MLFASVAVAVTWSKATKATGIPAEKLADPKPSVVTEMESWYVFTSGPGNTGFGFEKNSMV